MRNPQREAKLFQASLDGNLDLVNQLLPKTYVDAKNENSKWTFLMCAGNLFLNIFPRNIIEFNK